MNQRIVLDATVRLHDEPDSLARGRDLAEEFLWELEMHGAPPPRTILDFGCGSGQIIRHLIARGGIRCHGTDTDQAGVAFCRKHLAEGTFGVNNVLPPLRYPSRTFDFVYAHSVFTHIDLAPQVAWLRELRRVTVPGGFVRISTMGEIRFRGLGEAIPRPVRDEFRAKGFVSFRSFTDGALPEWCQSTFHSTAFGLELFERELGEVVEFRPGLPTEAWHDPEDAYIVRVRT